MEDVSAIAALVGILRAAREGLRGLQQGKLSAEHRRAVEDALDQLVNAQDRLSEIQAESIKLRDDNDKLKRQIAEADNWTKRVAEYQLFQAEGGAHVYMSLEGQPSHFACPVCLEKERQIQVLQDLRTASGHYDCPCCKARYRVKPPKQVKHVVRRAPWVTRY